MADDPAQKIEKLKGQLTALADLVAPYLSGVDKDNDGLDEDELDVLRKAGVISSGSKVSEKSKRRSKNHILFVESAEEGERKRTKLLDSV